MDDRQSDFERLISPIEDRMMRCVWRIVRDPEDADDAFQEALANIWKKWSTVLRHPNPQALVLRMCIYAAHDNLRRKVNRMKWQNADEMPEDTPDRSASALQSLSQAEESGQVLRAIGALPRNQARAILMHAIEEMPYNEIAAVMDCRESTVRKHVFRARVKLRNVLSCLIPLTRKEEKGHAQYRS
jgi:RNA polymerase sigma-70 factor (ECF subfamily)